MTSPRNGPPRSTTADVFRAIQAVYAAMGDPTSFHVGERHDGENDFPPHISLQRGGGTGTPPFRYSAGSIAGVKQTFTAYVWASGDEVVDLDRYDLIDAAEDRFTNVLQFLMPGKYEVSSIDPSMDSNILTYGEELQIKVTYLRDVPTDAAVWAVPMTAISPSDPDRPHGDTGHSVSVSITAEQPTR